MFVLSRSFLLCGYVMIVIVTMFIVFLNENYG